MELPIFWCLKILSTYTDAPKWQFVGASIKKVGSFGEKMMRVPFFSSVFPCFRPPAEDKKGCSLSSLLETTDEGNPPWGPGAVVFSVQFLSANHDNLLQLTTTCCLKNMLIHTDLELRMQVGLVRKMRASSFHRATWEDIRRIHMDWNRRATEIV